LDSAIFGPKGQSHSFPGGALILTHISRAERTHREVQPQLGSGWRSSLLSEPFVDQQLAIDAEQRGGLAYDFQFSPE